MEPAQDLPIRSPVKQKYHHYNKLWWLLRAPFVWKWGARKNSLNGEHQVLNHGFWGLLYPIFRPNDHPTSNPNSRLFPYFHKFVTWPIHFICIYIYVRDTIRISFSARVVPVCVRDMFAAQKIAEHLNVRWLEVQTPRRPFPPQLQMGGWRALMRKPMVF